MKTLFIALKAVVYMTGFLVFFGWVAWNVRVLDRRMGVLLPPWTGALGILCTVLGGGMALLCAAIFVARGRGTPAVFDPPPEFVALGPYKVVRNPMYIGGLALLVGFGLYERSVSMPALAAALFLLVHLFVIYIEEPQLKRRFGSTYEGYCQAVPRWIPRGGRTGSS